MQQIEDSVPTRRYPCSYDRMGEPSQSTPTIGADAERGDPFFFRYVDIHLDNEAKDQDYAKCGSLRSLQWSSKSQQSIQFIKDQIRACSSRGTSHHRCRTYHKTQLPTRTICIDLEHDTIYLQENSLLDEDVYAALSHCWAPVGRHPVRNLKSTISQFREPRPISDLTAVFQDAITLQTAWIIQHMDRLAMHRPRR